MPLTRTPTAERNSRDRPPRRLLGPGRTVAHGSSARYHPVQAGFGKLEKKIETAGRPWNLDVNGLLVLKLISLTVGLVILVVLAAVNRLPALWFVVLAVFVVVFTYYLPDLMVRSAANKRKEQIARALPDFLDLLTVSVEAGLGLDSAMAKIAERLHGPLQEEILITLHQIRMGKARHVALREFADRCDVDDLTNFISALIQSQQLGISLGQVLRVQSEQSARCSGKGSRSGRRRPR